MSGGITLTWLSLFWTANPVVDVPPNDNCANAEPIAGQGVFEFDNTHATTDGPPHYDEFCGLAGMEMSGIPYDVWYCWTAPLNGQAAVDTCTGTTVDTKVAIYEGCDCPGEEMPRLLGCDDNACVYQSHAPFTAVAGERYLIRIGTSDHNLITGGAGTFLITYGPSPGPSLMCGSLLETCQTPDHSSALSSNRYDFTVTDNFIPAADGYIEDVCWWGAYWNELGEYVHTPLDTFEVCYYDNAGGIPGALLAGPFSQLLGSLTVEGPVLTPTALVGTHREYEYRATHAPVPVFAGECYWLEITNASYYYTEWYWETSPWGDRRAVQDGAVDGAPDGYELADAVGEDLAFCIDLPLSDPEECAPVPDNDECASASAISKGTTFFDTTGASTDGPTVPLIMPEQDSPCAFALGDDQVHQDVWFDYEPPCPGLMTIDLCDCSFDTKVAVYRGRDCPPVDDPVACNDDACGEAPGLQSQVFLEVRDGTAYKIRVGGYAQAAGPGLLRLDFVVAPPSNTNLYDYAKFAACLTRPCGTPPCVPPLYSNRCCQAQDFDSDGAVDLSDYAEFHSRWLGP